MFGKNKEKDVTEKLRDTYEQAIEDFAEEGIDGDDAKEKAEIIKTLGEADAKAQETKRAKWDVITNIAKVVFAAVATLGVGALTYKSQQDVCEKEIDYLEAENEKRRKWESEGEVNYIPVAPSSKKQPDGLKIFKH